MKNSMYKLIAGFMRNPVKINIISESGKITSHLKNSKESHIKLKAATYICLEGTAIREGRIDNYYFNENNTVSIKINKESQNELKPEYLTDLLLSAELHGSNNFIADLIKFKWILLSCLVVAGGMIYLIYKIGDLSSAVNSTNAIVEAIKSARVVG